jgi:hypothetical protein
MTQPDNTKPQPDDAHRVQGEGDYDAARRYDKGTTDYAKSGKVEEAARNAKPTSEAEADELRRAESEGKSHAKGEDPALHRPGKDMSRGA